MGEVTRYTFYQFDADGTSPGEGRMEPESDGDWITFLEAQKQAKRALDFLKEGDTLSASAVLRVSFLLDPK